MRHTLAAIAAASLLAAAASAAPTTTEPAAFSKPNRGTLGAALPTPGAWVLIGLGGLALVRASRKNKPT